jgi:hypothetical protein
MAFGGSWRVNSVTGMDWDLFRSQQFMGQSNTALMGQMPIAAQIDQLELDWRRQWE